MNLDGCLAKPDQDHFMSKILLYQRYWNIPSDIYIYENNATAIMCMRRNLLAPPKNLDPLGIRPYPLNIKSLARNSVFILSSTLSSRLPGGTGVHSMFRGSLPEVFSKKGVLRNFTKFTGKHLRQSHLCHLCNFIKKETLAQVFSCEFCEFLRAPFLQSTSGGCFCMLHWEKSMHGQKLIEAQSNI